MGEVQALPREEVFGIFIKLFESTNALPTNSEDNVVRDSFGIRGLSTIFLRESQQTDRLLHLFPLPHGRDLASISLVGIICILQL